MEKNILILVVGLLTFSQGILADSMPVCPKNIGEESGPTYLNSLVEYGLKQSGTPLLSGETQIYQKGIEGSITKYEAGCSIESQQKVTFVVVTNKINYNDLANPIVCEKEISVTKKFSAKKPPQYSYALISTTCP